MVSKRFKADDGWTGRRIDFPAFSRALSKRRAELGVVDPTDPKLVRGRNAGKDRTPSKRALLKAIEEAGGKW